MSIHEKKTRTVRLTYDMNARLEAVCDHLGTNVNAFLITKIGEIVSTSEITFKSLEKNNAMLKMGADLMDNVQLQLKEHMEKQIPLDQDS